MKKKFLRPLLVTFILMIIVFFIAYNYIYQDHRDIATEQAKASLKSTQLVDKFINSPQDADSLFLDQTIEVNGIVTSIGDGHVVLDENVFCTFQTNPEIELGSNITVKGRCIGFDDLLEEVKIDQCIIVK